ncbi:MAG TPA: class I SAM-dependent methyltransferase [Vicinamibacterales bacterium]|nr:class I SAM-dependent methyltransferase [Vicinamibacterales bacterium]
MAIADRLRSALSHPLARGRDLDDPSTTALRRHILEDKPALAAIYREWYAWLGAQLPTGAGAVLELGSGAGFARNVIPGLVASDVFVVPGLDLVLDAQRLPFRDESLRAVVMTNVLHHLPDLAAFFRDAHRAVRPGGVVAMIEPWTTTWSAFVYRRLHHELFSPEAQDWTVEAGGPLSGANVAAPWIAFKRDRQRFERELPGWRIATIDPCLPFRYLLTGGVSLRMLAPAWTFGVVNRIEGMLERWPDRFAMFARVLLVRT